MRGDLRKRCLMSLAMVLHAHVDQNTAVRQHPDICRLVARDYAKLAFDEFDRAVTTLLGIKRKSHANPAFIRLARRLPLADRWQINLVARDIKRGNIVSGVELQTGCGLVRKFSCGDDVLSTQIEWLAPQFPCNLVDQAFECKSCSRASHPAIGTHGGLVRGDGVGVEFQMADAIRPRQIARGHASFLKSARRPQGVGAGIDVDLSLDAEKRAIPVSRNGQVVGVISGVDRREQMFTTVLDPSHRMLDLQCDRSDGNIFRHNAVLPAEAAAYIRSDDANLLFGQAKHPGKREPFDLAALGRKVDDELVKAVVPVGENAPSFE